MDQLSTTAWPPFGLTTAYITHAVNVKKSSPKTYYIYISNILYYMAYIKHQKHDKATSIESITFMQMNSKKDRSDDKSSRRVYGKCRCWSNRQLKKWHYCSAIEKKDIAIYQPQRYYTVIVNAWKVLAAVLFNRMSKLFYYTRYSVLSWSDSSQIVARIFTLCRRIPGVKSGRDCNCELHWLEENISLYIYWESLRTILTTYVISDKALNVLRQ